jgi:hypothetical protein
MIATIDVAEQLRQAIRASGRAPYGIALEARVEPKTMSAFLKGRVGLSLKSAARLMQVLGLEVKRRGA